MPIGAVLGTVVGGIAQASAARRAASAQTQAADASIAEQRRASDASLGFQREAFATTQANLDPFRQAGNTANAAVMYELGLGQRPQGYAGFQATPGYQFQIDQGTAAVNALAGAQGGRLSGRTLQDLTQLRQGLASQEYGNYFNRLSGVQGIGANAAAGVGSAAQNLGNNASNITMTTAGNVGNALSDRGNAQGAGYVGGANALSGAINNGIGIMAYQQGLSQQQRGTSGGYNNGYNFLFGGKGLGGFV